MKKIVHILEITPMQHNLIFQIKLPLQTKFIESILVYSNVPKNLANGMKNCGLLNLSVSGIPNLFFSESIAAPTLDYKKDIQNKVIQKFTFGKGEQWIDGTLPQVQNLSIPLENNLIEGFYQNLIEFVEQTPYRIFILLDIQS